MDNHYLILLRKDDIIDFFRYGKWKVFSPSIKFDEPVEQLPHNKKLMDKLFKQANPFGYSIEYFLVHLRCPKISQIEIDDIIDIFPLDKDSKRIGLSLSPEIRLGEPIFEDSYTNFQIANEIEDAKKGIDNIFAIFGLLPPKKFINKSDLEKIVRDSYINAPIDGKNCIWYYLLRYDRHQSYPKDNRGFALDAIHAFLNYEKCKDMDVSIIYSKIGGIIMNQETTINYMNIISLIEKQKEFLKRCEKAYKGYYRIAPLFLTLKNALLAGVRNENKYFGMDLPTFVRVMKDKYDNEDLAKALYLIGIVLGRENTYQYIYKKNKPEILK